jgi:hypothetical protein
MYLGVVLNPLARKNRHVSAERYARIERILGPWGEVVRTPDLSALRPAVEHLLPRVTHLVSDGGDGALHQLINEVRSISGGDATAAKWPAFVPTNGGTIDFVAHKAGVRGNSEAILRVLTGAAAARRPPPTMRIDTMHVRGETASGESFDRIGFAMAAGGVGQRFFDLYYEDPNPRPMTIVSVIARTIWDFGLERVGRSPAGRASYAAHMFAPTHAKVVIDGEELPSRRCASLHAGSFDVNLGGVVRLFPFAREPGVLHFMAGDISPTMMIRKLPAIFYGRPIHAAGLIDGPGTHMEVETFEVPLDPVIDGERFEGLCRLDVQPGPAVRIAQVAA